MQKKEAVLAGIGGGILFGGMQILSTGFVAGLSGGVFFGACLGVMCYLFANSKLVKGQTSVSDEVLLPGERVLLSKLANLVIRPQEFGLDKFAFDGLLWTVGMKNKESLGGAIHLTNYRIIFQSHRYNRIRGMTSIFLPTVDRLENRTVLVFRKLAVVSGSARVEFVVSDVDHVISQITAARDEMDDATLAELKEHALAHPEKCNDALEQWTALNHLNTLFNFGKKTTGAASLVTNPLATLGSRLTSELLNRTIVDATQHTFNAVAEQKGKESSRREAA